MAKMANNERCHLFSTTVDKFIKYNCIKGDAKMLQSPIGHSYSSYERGFNPDIVALLDEDKMMELILD